MFDLNTVGVVPPNLESVRQIKQMQKF